MAKVIPRGVDPRVTTVNVKTSTAAGKGIPSDWWNGGSKKEIAEKLLSTVSFLKEKNFQRHREAALYALMYGNRPIISFGGASGSNKNMTQKLPMDRPTMSVITSCIDTLVSRISQSKPRPVFLTDNGNYKQRNLSKQLNQFIAGENYRSGAHKIGALILRDACIFGTGAIKILEGQDKKVSLERRLATDILVDSNDSHYGEPRQLYELKMVDRAVLQEMFPKYRADIARAEEGTVDRSSDSTKSIADQVIVAEGWHLPSGPDSKDGLHVIACSEGIIFESAWEKEKFPFSFLHYSPQIVGFWGDGLAYQLMGTQNEINGLLQQISKSIKLVGVPRIYLEESSKVVKAHLNNDIGSIVTFRGQPPIFSTAECMPQEVYAQLQRLVEYAYQQSGISQLSANSQKPMGLNSGVALREYDDLQTDRFAALVRRYDELYVDLAYQIIDKAKDIAERDGSYGTVYPDKDGTREVPLPEADLLDDTYIIQAYDSSSLPRDPAGRLQKITEMMQAGLISPPEGRRLLSYPDIEQVDKLANSAEERIFKALDKIVDKGEFTAPDRLMGPPMAVQYAQQYYNLYVDSGLEPEKAQLLRDFLSQAQDFIDEDQAQVQAAQQAQAQQAAGLQAQASGKMANPQALPTSEMLPNVG